MSLRTLFSKTSAFFWQHSRLWMPVLLAEGVKFLVAEVATPIRHAAIDALLPRSVLGGYAGPENHLPVASFLAGVSIKWRVPHLREAKVGSFAQSANFFRRGKASALPLRLS